MYAYLFFSEMPILVLYYQKLKVDVTYMDFKSAIKYIHLSITCNKNVMLFDAFICLLFACVHDNFKNDELIFLNFNVGRI